MKKYVLGFVTGIVLLLLSINAYAIDVGFGAEVDDGDMELDLSIDWNIEHGKWQTNIEFDYVTEENDGEEEENLTYFNLKQNYQVTPKLYVLSLLQVDNDKYRPNYETRTVLGAGFGYKVYRSERIKVSNEYSIAYLESNESEAIIRNSTWISYKIADKLSATNKFLYEGGNESYTRNEFTLDYELADNITVGIAWRMIDEGFQERDTKSIQFGITF
tara:strand:- start:309 stop:959 length:651 start_codon:yes stop_codon:yes gene_type:complete